MKQAPPSRGGGGVFFLKSERRDLFNTGRGGGFFERQSVADKVEYNSDDELVDEFGRKKKKRKTTAAKPAKPYADDAKASPGSPASTRAVSSTAPVPRASEPSSRDLDFAPAASATASALLGGTGAPKPVAAFSAHPNAGAAGAMGANL